MICRCWCIYCISRRCSWMTYWLTWHWATWPTSSCCSKSTISTFSNCRSISINWFIFIFSSSTFYFWCYSFWWSSFFRRSLILYCFRRYFYSSFLFFYNCCYGLFPGVRCGVRATFRCNSLCIRLRRSVLSCLSIRSS